MVAHIEALWNFSTAAGSALDVVVFDRQLTTKALMSGEICCFTPDLVRTRPVVFWCQRRVVWALHMGDYLEPFPAHGVAEAGEEVSIVVGELSPSGRPPVLRDLLSGLSATH